MTHRMPQRIINIKALNVTHGSVSATICSDESIVGKLTNTVTAPKYAHAIATVMTDYNLLNYPHDTEH